MKRNIWIILLLAFVIRLIHSDQSFWLDEASHAVRASGDWQEQFNLATDFHPPLGYIVTFVFARMGTNEVWLRLSSIVPGVVTVWLVYLIGRQFNERVGYWSAGLLAVAPYHIYYSQELRMYALSAMWSSLLIYTLMTRRWWLHALSVVGGMYTLYLFPFMFVAEAAWMLITRDTDWKFWMRSWVIGGLCFLPWLPTFWEQIQQGSALPTIWPAWSMLSSVSIYKVIPLTYAKFVWGRITFDSDMLNGGMVFASLPFVVGALGASLYPLKSRWVKCLDTRQSRTVLLLWAWLGVPFLLALLCSLWLLPINGPWRLLFVLPALYVLIANGIDRIQYIKLRKFLFLSVFLISALGSLIYMTQTQFHREDWKSVNEFLYMKTIVSSRPVLIINVFPEPFAPMEWYGNRLPVVGITNGLVAEKDNLETQMRVQLVDVGDVYVFDYLQDLTDPDRLVLGWLDEHGYEEVDTFDFRGIGFVRHYVLRDYGVYAWHN